MAGYALNRMPAKFSAALRADTGTLSVRSRCSRGEIVMAAASQIVWRECRHPVNRNYIGTPLRADGGGLPSLSSRFGRPKAVLRSSKRTLSGSRACAERRFSTSDGQMPDRRLG
jgi:hypothetical protein